MSGILRDQGIGLGADPLAVFDQIVEDSPSIDHRDVIREGDTVILNFENLAEEGARVPQETHLALGAQTGLTG